MSYENDDVADELARLNDDFNAAPIPETGGSRQKIPDGDYQATVKNVAVKRSKAKPGKPPKLMLEWWLKIVGPTNRGAEVPRWNHFDTAEKLGYLKKDLAICGMSIENLASLERRLPELLDKVLEITIQNNGQYMNCYFNRLVERSIDENVPF